MKTYSLIILTACFVSTGAKAFDQEQFCNDMFSGKYDTHAKALVHVMVGSLEATLKQDEKAVCRQSGKINMSTKPKASAFDECMNLTYDEAKEEQQMLEKALNSYVKICGSPP